MEGKSNKITITTLLVISCFYLVGILGHLNEYTREFFINLTPFFLFCNFLIALLFAKDISLFRYSLVIMLFTWFLEALGTNFGILFGDYSYGNVLGLQIFKTPLLIGVNWALVVIGTIFWIEKYFYKYHIVLKSFIVGISATLFDYFLEPAAIKLEYWAWEGNIIPLYNYITWFLVSFICTLIYYKLVKNIENIKLQVFGFLIIAQLIFFLCITYF